MTLLLALTGAVGFAGYSWWRSESTLNSQQEKLEQVQKSLDRILGEVTRMRLEQSAEGKGPAALLEKLKTYAPLTSNARITEPDFQNAKKELQSIVYAFEACGDEAWKPVNDRLAEADPRKDFDEIKWLLEIALRLNPSAGKQISQEVLLGHRLPHPRLRWWAAQLLITHDKPLAQNLLRRVLLTESSRGPDASRMPGMKMPDPAAYATNGFNNFVQRYILSDDPKTEDTLLMLLTRVEHDAITIQDCVKELGRRKSKRALAAIKKTYVNPPNKQQNPLFLMICAQAVFDIAGHDSKTWLEEQLAKAPTDIVANKIRSLLK